MIPIAKPTIGKEELQNVEKVFKTNWLGMGSFVYEFEKRIEKYIGVKYVIATNTGTTAIHLALASIGIKPGDEVIVPSLTFAGSVQPIKNLGAKPIFCEVEKDTLNIDVQDMSRRITKKTKAVIVVHYGGLSCDMDPILKITKKKKIKVIEDAAHAFGSKYKGRKIGSFGDLACFSFDPIKNLTCGEGGCVTTNNPKLAEVLRRKRLLGISKDTWMRYKNKRSWFYEIVTEGYRYHMSNINAAVGLAQFEKLKKFIDKKKKLVKAYDECFKSLKEISLLRRNYKETAPFNYTIRILQNKSKISRNNFVRKMEKNGISVGINYIPNHIQPFFRPYRVKLPVTEKIWKEIVSLPLYYDMGKKEFDKVVKTVKKLIKGKA